MDIEQLKIVVELVSKLSDNATTAFVWWLVLDKVLPFVIGISAVIAIYKVVMTITNRFIHYVHLESIRDAAGFGTFEDINFRKTTKKAIQALEEMDKSK